MIYEQLSKDPHSLANLDQDLPNYAQHQIPIHSLPQEWLWCESWCGNAIKAKVGPWGAGGFGWGPRGRGAWRWAGGGLLASAVSEALFVWGVFHVPCHPDLCCAPCSAIPCRALPYRT